MSKANELFKLIYDYCVEYEKCIADTANGWNSTFGSTFGSATFTALVNQGRLERYKYHNKNPYTYRIIPVGKLKELEKQEKRKKAEDVINSHADRIELIQKRYERQIREAEEWLESEMAREEEKLETAKKVIEG